MVLEKFWRYTWPKQDIMLQVFSINARTPVECVSLIIKFIVMVLSSGSTYESNKRWNGAPNTDGAGTFHNTDGLFASSGHACSTGNWLGPAMKTVMLTLTQMAWIFLTHLGVIGKIHTLLLSGCPIALSQLVCMHMYSQITTAPQHGQESLAVYISN